MYPPIRTVQAWLERLQRLEDDIARETRYCEDGQELFHAVDEAVQEALALFLRARVELAEPSHPTLPLA